MDENIREAIKGRVNGEGWFFNQVRRHGPWDYKRIDKKNENFGNFNYGMTGTAFWYSESTLLRMAGWNQSKGPNVAPGWGYSTNMLFSYLGFGGKAPFGDDPNDQYWIKQGINYYHSTDKSAKCTKYLIIYI